MHILKHLILSRSAKISPLSLFCVLLLAASAHKRCTSLVCSCYVASRNSDSKDEEIIRNKNTTTSSSSRNQNLLPSYNKDGFLEQEGRFCRLDHHHKSRTDHQVIKNINGDSSSGSKSHNNVATTNEPMPLKSNLKKGTKTMELMRIERRRVNWPDALGKDIAHIQEFEPSVSEDGELESVHNSCICVIQ